MAGMATGRITYQTQYLNGVYVSLKELIDNNTGVTDLLVGARSTSTAPPTNLAATKPATGADPCTSTAGQAKAVIGSMTGGKPAPSYEFRSPPRAP